jgi:transcriptional regulator with XRE-family HTH domain
MKTKTVITLIKQLLKRYGNYEKVARELGVTARYVRHLEKGERIPSNHLRKLIKMVLK